MENSIIVRTWDNGERNYFVNHFKGSIGAVFDFSDRKSDAQKMTKKEAKELLPKIGYEGMLSIETLD